MANIAQTLHAEIQRLARKEVRQQLRANMQPLKAAITAQRAALAALRSRARDMQVQLRALQRQRAADTPLAPEAPGAKLRFRPAGLATNRKRLGLSSADFAALIGVTAKAVLDWEKGLYRPSDGHLRQLAELRGMPIKQARERLARIRRAASPQRGARKSD